MSVRIVGVLLLLCVRPVWAEELQAVLEWAKRVELTPQISGQVTAVAVESGERVAKSAVLLRFDDRLFRAHLVAAEAAVVRAEKRYAEAQRELQRADELYDRTVLSNHEYEQAKLGHAEAEAALRSTEALQVEAELNLEHSVVRAPFDAWVVERLAEPGTVLLNPLQARPLLVVAEAGRMRARAAIVGSRLAALKLGQACSVNVAGKHFKARVVALALEPQSVGGEARYSLVAEFSSGGERLYAGQSVSLTLP